MRYAQIQHPPPRLVCLLLIKVDQMEWGYHPPRRMRDAQVQHPPLRLVRILLIKMDQME